MNYFKKNRIIYVAALIKLVSNAVIVLFCHRSLAIWKTGLFGNLADTYGTIRDRLFDITGKEIGYHAFLIGGMVLFSILYLAAVSLIPIENQKGYRVFALAFIIDSLLLMYPCKELLTVLFAILLVAALRLRGPLRYVLAGAVYVLAAFLISPYLLIAIPIYLGVRAWERNSRLGILVCLGMLALFCILYETGAMVFLLDIRPESFSGATGFVKAFPGENYGGHVSYYLLDYLYTFGRILVPYEVFSETNVIMTVYFLLQIASLICVLFLLLGEFEVDRKKGDHNDRMRADVLVALCSVYAAMAVYIPDYPSAMRMLAALYPMFLYLLFGPAKKPFLVCEDEEDTVTESDADKSEESEKDDKADKKESSEPKDTEDEDYL